MLPNFKILAFFWRQFYSIASKKKLLLTYTLLFSHTEAEIKKKREENKLGQVNS